MEDDHQIKRLRAYMALNTNKYQHIYSILSKIYYMSSNKDKNREIINITLDETKSTVKKTTDEAIKEIPRYTKAVNDYQEESIQAAKEIADNFLESQKEIIHSLQSLWIPYVENVQNS
jgi:S-ribosylhomocysteine lyase LuxS involved in autoinducer biosynthesis